MLTDLLTDSLTDLINLFYSLTKENLVTVRAAAQEMEVAQAGDSGRAAIARHRREHAYVVADGAAALVIVVKSLRIVHHHTSHIYAIRRESYIHYDASKSVWQRLQSCDSDD